VRGPPRLSATSCSDFAFISDIGMGVLLSEVGGVRGGGSGNMPSRGTTSCSEGPARPLTAFSPLCSMSGTRSLAVLYESNGETGGGNMSGDISWPGSALRSGPVFPMSCPTANVGGT
jgi:hypothetical protein